MRLAEHGRMLLVAAAALTTSLLCWACGDGTPSAAPSPAAIDTAEAASRPVSFGAAFSTTPAPGDDDRDEPIVLRGRVFGDGPTGVILVHMRPADQTAWFPFATRLAATGDFTVLTFDFRGFNESSGDKEFDRADTDLQAAYDFMRDELDIADVYLIGASIGGTAALVVASREDVSGVAAISALAEYQQLDALDEVEAISVPKLFITSEDDVAAMRSLDMLWEAAAAPKEQEIVPGNAHGTDVFASPRGRAVEDRLLAFIGG